MTSLETREGKGQVEGGWWRGGERKRMECEEEKEMAMERDGDTRERNDAARRPFTCFCKMLMR